MEKVYIMGGAQTDFERNWTKEGKGFVALLKEAVFSALDNTNLTIEEIKSLNQKNRIACFIGNFCAEYYVQQDHY